MDDLLGFNALLEDDERMIRDTVADFVRQEVLPNIGENFEKGVFPEAYIQHTAKMGLLGLTLPTEYGGSDASYIAYGLVCQELERGDSGLRSFVSVQSSLCMYPIFRYGSEWQKKTFLPAMAKGECIGCFGLTESDSGSDPASMKTHARKVKGGYILSGSKMWITNAPIAHIAIIWAQVDKGIHGFIVDLSWKGCSRTEIKEKMSLRASHTGGLFFDEVFVPDDHVLPEAKTLGTALSCLNEARYGIAWGVMGAAAACFDIARDYLGTRMQFSKPLASFQLIQADLADMYSEIVKTQALHMRLGQLKDAGQVTPTMISLAKRNACRQALHITRTCRNLLGANGISLEYHVIRHMLNLEAVFTYEGTDNIHTLVLGRHITGISAWS